MNVMAKLRDALPLILLLGFAIVCLSVLKVTGVINQLNLEQLRQWVLDQGWWGAVIFMLAYALRPVVFIPATPLAIFGGYTFGVWLGTIYDVIGAFVGALLSFYIARILGRTSVEKLLHGKKMLSFDHKIADNGFMVILYMRLLPLPFDGVSYGAGLSKVRPRDYHLATLIGILPGAFVFNYLGHSLRDIGSGQFFVAIAVYVVFAIAPLLYKRMKNKKPQKLSMCNAPLKW